LTDGKNRLSVHCLIVTADSFSPSLLQLLIFPASYTHMVSVTATGCGWNAALVWYRNVLVWLSTDGSGWSDPLLTGRRYDQVYGSHPASGLLSAERRGTTDPAQLLRHTAVVTSY